MVTSPLGRAGTVGSSRIPSMPRDTAGRDKGTGTGSVPWGHKWEQRSFPGTSGNTFSLWMKSPECPEELLEAFHLYRCSKTTWTQSWATRRAWARCCSHLNPSDPVSKCQELISQPFIVAINVPSPCQPTENSRATQTEPENKLIFPKLPWIDATGHLTGINTTTRAGTVKTPGNLFLLPTRKGITQ